VSGVYEKEFEVRWNDVDSYGHLGNTRYLEYGNHARISYFQEAQYPVSRQIREGLGAVLLEEQVAYRREALLGQLLTVQFQLTGLSPDGARWRVFHTFLHPDGAVAATLTSSGAWLDIKARKLATPPVELKSVMEAVRSADCETLE
jgi:acyl-CoA thioester hydrolase